MDNQFNPYQAPASDVIPKINNDAESLSCWTEGKYLVMPIEKGTLPHRCVRCNAPVDGLIKTRKLYWHHPALYLLILISILVYAVAAIIVRKKIVVQPGLCDEHENKRIKGIYLSLGVFFTSILLLFISTTNVVPSQLFFGIGIIGLLVGILLYAITSKILTVNKIKGNLVYFSKCGQPFLDSIRYSNRQL